MLYKIIVLFIIIALGWLSALFDANIIIKIGSARSELTGVDLENTSMNIIIAWMIGIATAIASLFIENKWRYLLLAGPILLPALYIVIYAITN